MQPPPVSRKRVTNSLFLLAENENAGLACKADFSHLLAENENAGLACETNFPYLPVLSKQQ